MIALLRLGFLVVLVAAWQIASSAVSSNIIASPADTFAAAQKLLGDGRLLDGLLDTLGVYLAGFTLAALVAIPAGVLMGMSRHVGKTLDIYVFALAATPRVAFIPLIIVLLGLGMEAKVFIVFLGAVMPIVINTHAGVLSVDEELIEMARSVAASRARIFWRIVLPGAVPFIVAGLRIGATIGLINTIVAELYTAVSGLGGLLALFGNTFRMAEYFVVVITLALVGVIITEVLRVAERRLENWRGRL